VGNSPSPSTPAGTFDALWHRRAPDALQLLGQDLFQQAGTHDPLHLVHDHSVAVDDPGSGQRNKRKGEMRLPGRIETQQIRHADLGGKLPGVRFDIVHGDADEFDFRMGLGNEVEIRHLGPAGRTPRRPERYPHGLPAEALQVDEFAVEARQLEVRGNAPQPWGRPLRRCAQGDRLAAFSLRCAPEGPHQRARCRAERQGHNQGARDPAPQRAWPARDLRRLARRYDLENSLLINLNIVGARLADVPIPAKYGNEVSGIRLWRVTPRIMATLFTGFWQRILLRYVLYNFHPVALFLFSGLALTLWGFGFGIWVAIRSLGPEAETTGTVMLAVLPFLMGFQLLLAAFVLDILSEPK